MLRHVQDETSDVSSLYILCPVYECPIRGYEVQIGVTGSANTMLDFDNDFRWISPRKVVQREIAEELLLVVNGVAVQKYAGRRGRQPVLTYATCIYVDEDTCESIFPDLDALENAFFYNY